MKRFLLYMTLLFIVQCSVPKNDRNYHQEYTHYLDQYKKGFLESARSPLGKEDLDDLDFYPGDGTWKLICECESARESKPFEMPTYSGVTRTYILHSIATCKYNTHIIKLNLYKNIHQPINPLYKNNLFLPFKDYTNGEDTYGGGRYINLLVTDIKEGKIIIDFNKAYNPWCAYSDGFNCPIPPKENHIGMSILVGEKNFKGAYKKSNG